MLMAPVIEALPTPSPKVKKLPGGLPWGGQSRGSMVGKTPYIMSTPSGNEMFFGSSMFDDKRIPLNLYGGELIDKQFPEIGDLVRDDRIGV